MDEPAPFLQSDKDGKLQISQEAKEILPSLKQPVTVVAIAGLYRTGKSFLLNRLAGKQTGFPLGSTVQAKTKGIWFWVVPHPSSPDSRQLVLLDTEGLADPEHGDSTHDAWIFSMAVLLSSCLVYNSVGTIDDRAIDTLHLVTELTERIRTKAAPEHDQEQDESGDDFDSFFPSFFWVLRDFALELRLNGRACTANEYLENSLKLKSGINRRVQMYNLPRQALKAFFRERECFTMIRPVDEESQLRNLEALTERELKPQFLEDANVFCQAVFDRVPNKSIAGKELNGSMLLAITGSYSEALNNGAVPCIGSAFKSMADLENRRAVEEGLNTYRSRMHADLSDILPFSLDKLSTSHLKAEKEAVSTFLSIAVADRDRKCQEELQERLTEEREVWVKRNEEMSTGKCRQIIEELYRPIRDALQRGEYTGKGGYVKYQEDREILQQKYEKMPDKGVSAANVLSAFNKEHEDEAQAILAADTALSEKQKQLEEANREAKEKELAAKAAEQKAEEVKQKMIDEQKSHIIHIQELEKKQSEEMEIAREEFERKAEKAKKEQEELLRAGFNEQAKLMNEQIEIIKRNKKESERAAQEQMENARKAIERQEREIEDLRRNPPIKEKKGTFAQLGKLLGKAVDAIVPMFQLFPASNPENKDSVQQRPPLDDPNVTGASAPVEDDSPATTSASGRRKDRNPEADETQESSMESESGGSSATGTPLTTDAMFEELNKRFPTKKF